MLYYYEKTAEDQNLAGKEQDTLLARKVLAVAVKREYHLSRLPEIEKEQMGKPYFRGFPSIYFNYSHCIAGIFCGVSDYPIGVDVESARPFRPSLPEYICHPAEKQILYDHSQEPDLFWILWTAKESYLKYKGTGIRKPLAEIDLSQLLDAWIRHGRPSFHAFFWSAERLWFCMDKRSTPALMHQENAAPSMLRAVYLCACGPHLENQKTIEIISNEN